MKSLEKAIFWLTKQAAWSTQINRTKYKQKKKFKPGAFSSRNFGWERSYLQAYVVWMKII
jgi:hypothetical protein